MADKIPNPRLRAVRDLRFKMSREEFADLLVEAGAELGEAVGCTPRLIAAWEDGEVAMPRPVYQRILHHLTGLEMAELGFNRRGESGAVPVARGGGPDEEEPVRRRGS
ncbi:helix-turn-helix transcriptional regulator [Streptomyces acidiscabies]|uniref:helix-turn-helix domain-containing protein n=1 Tax=Streptomyces acidiscabies TaxID=42234 RepID=UPI0030CBC8AB